MGFGRRHHRFYGLDGRFWVFMIAGLAMVLGAGGGAPAAAAAEEAPPAGDIAALVRAGDELARPPKSIDNLKRAIEAYETALAREPDHFEALWKCADAYVYLMQMETDALLVEKDEHKALLADLGQKALQYGEKAYAIHPRSREAIMANLGAYAYYAASFGIIKAVLKGAAGHYTDLAGELIAVDETYKNGIAHVFLARLYAAAPWPVGSRGKAEKHFRKALEVAPQKLEPHYFLGRFHLEDGDLEEARAEFAYVLAHEPDPWEEHYMAAIKADARERLAQLNGQP